MTFMYYYFFQFGALFASKGHSHEHQTWTPHQKEIHLHIHNNGGYHGDDHNVPICKNCFVAPSIIQ